MQRYFMMIITIVLITLLLLNFNAVASESEKNISNDNTESKYITEKNKKTNSENTSEKYDNTKTKSKKIEFKENESDLTKKVFSSIEKNFQMRFEELAKEEFKNQKLRQYGYNFFKQPASNVKSITQLPIGPDYVIKPGDELIINIYGNVYKEYTLEVKKDGSINIPEVGPINIWGLSFRQVKETLRKHVQSYYSGVEISVTMGDLRSISIYVTGEVNSPGIYQISSLSTVLHALFKAHGITKTGSMRDIKILRDDKEVATLDLYKFLIRGKKKADIHLEDGDVINVPGINNIIAIGGEIKNPAIYENLEGIKVSKLIELAGGLTSSANLNIVKLERIKNHEKRILKEVSINNWKDFIDSKNDIELKNSDIIFIGSIIKNRMPERNNYVSINGNIKQPGNYQFIPDMKLEDLLEKANGILPETYKIRAEIWRYVSDKTRKVIPVNLTENNDDINLKLKEWDIVKVYADYDIYPSPIVDIRGEVNKPGSYKFVEGMTVRDLIFRAKELTNKAYKGRAELFRLKNSSLREVIPVDLNKVFSEEEKIKLQEKDFLKIYPVEWVYPSKKVSIEGAVYKPGEYELVKNMYLSDLIFKSGSFKENAYLKKLEIYRYNYDQGGNPEVITVDASNLIVDTKTVGEHKENDVKLQANDRICVRVKKVNTQLRTVTILGEVHLPGKYIINPGEKLASVIKRAGGLTEIAYPYGAVFTRKNIKAKQSAVIKDYVNYQKQKIEEERVRIKELSLTTKEREEKIQTLNHRENALELMMSRLPKGRIIFDLQEGLSNNKNFNNLIVYNEDKLVIPPEPQVVIITGEVYNPESIIYQKGKDIDYYLKQVGGITEKGEKDKIYIMKANGKVETKYTGYNELKQGDIIVVPSINYTQGGTVNE